MQAILTLTLPLEEAREVYRALIARYFVEDALRREQGLEPINLSALTERLEKTLGFTEATAEKEQKMVEDELWQHAWLSFTDEWAWHRAKQDVIKELGTRRAATFTSAELDALTEAHCETHFERYTQEIQLPGHEPGGSCEWPTKATATKKTIAKTSKKSSRRA